MRYLYYCNSAYQILTVMNLHWQRKYCGFENIKDYDGDLIILNSFSEAEDISERIRKSGLFHQVLLINKAYNSGKLHAFRTLIDLLSPSVYLKEKYGIKKKGIKNVYEIISVPKYSMVTSAIWRLNPKARLHIIEDGVGTYFGSMRLTPDSKLFRKFYKQLNHGRTFYDYDAIYLNDASLFTGANSEKIVDIPSFPDKLMGIVNQMFDDYARTDHEPEKRVYYFAQFLNNQGTISFIDNLLNYLENYKKDILYVPHPRHKDDKTYDLDYAAQKQIWELKQLNIKELNDKMLISIHSTACMTPKILFDKEPYVLLFYKLCDDAVTTRNERFDRFIELFTNSYSDQSKIMIPETIDEFKQFIIEYLDKTK